MRIHELAKKYGMPAQAFMGLLKTLKISASSHMSALSAEEALRVSAHFKTGTKTEEKKPILPSGLNPSEPVTKKGSGILPKKGVTSKGGGKQAVLPPVALEEVAAPRKSVFLVKKKKESPVSTDTGLVADVTSPSPKIVHTDGIVTPVTQEEGGSEALSPQDPLIPKENPSVVPVQTEAGDAVQPDPKRDEPLLKAPPISKTPPDEKKHVSKGVSLVEEASPSTLRKTPRNRFLEKPKKEVLSFVDTAQVLSDEPPIQQRKWQDFRPTHKRQAPPTLSKGQTPVVDITKPRRKIIKIHEGLTVKEFSALMGTKISVLISKLMGMGKMITANQLISMEDAFFLSEELGVNAELVSESTEEEILRPQAPEEGAHVPERIIPRPPVITIMGHVDHGKTSLLDAVRKTKVQEGESGGITQHIGAYTVPVQGKAVTFLDTPGHEAFTAMRARGAKVTDIVVLVVAADDGVMPQTVEAIHHAQAANVPILVAINKMDTPEANPERIKTALSEYGLMPEAWGGKTLYVEVSAKQKIGLEHFMEMILLQAEVLELTGNPEGWMKGIVIEAKLSKGRGPVATVLVQQGTLRVGDTFVAGVHSGRVRTLISDTGEHVKEASLSMPVEVIGFSGVPSAGDTFIVTEDERVAKDVAQDRFHRQRLTALAHAPRVTLQNLSQHIQEGNVEELRLVLKADVQGSVGALADALEKLSTAAVKVRIIHKGVGGITESDVLLASASSAIVIGFHVRPNTSVSVLAEREKIDIRLYEVIYDALDDVKKAMTGLLAPTYKVKVVGRADVRQIFQVPKIGTICGCYVNYGVISRSGTRVHLLRDQVMVYEGKLSSLRRFKDDVKDVQTGFECGIGIDRFNDVKVGDVIEVYIQEEVAASL